jgi:hypothetical protein
MKKLALALLAVTSFSALAQNLDRDIQMKIDRLSNARNDISRLSYGEKSDLNNALSNAINVLRLDDRRPGPGPIPGPGPSPFPGQNNGGRGRGPRFDVQATVMVSDPFSKSVVITLGGRNPGDILAQCTQQFPALGFNTVSRLVITSNNNAYESVRIFASNASDVCTNIVNHMKPGRPDWQFIDVSGTFQDPFSSSGVFNIAGDRGEVLEQCVDQVSRAKLNTISKLTISVNRSALIQKNIFASNAGDTCAALVDILNQQAP